MLAVVGAFAIALLKQHRRVTVGRVGTMSQMPKHKAVGAQSLP